MDIYVLYSIVYSVNIFNNYLTKFSCFDMDGRFISGKFGNNDSK